MEVVEKLQSARQAVQGAYQAMQGKKSAGVAVKLAQIMDMLNLTLEELQKGQATKAGPVLQVPSFLKKRR
jgi:hypothetical protein